MSHFGEIKTVTAAKEHDCMWCTEKIAKGEQHPSQFVIFDGRSYTSRLHTVCQEALGREQQLETWDSDDGFEAHSHIKGMTTYESEEERRRLDAAEEAAAEAEEAHV